MRVVSQRGFTLIELLVVVTVMTVILGAIYQSIGSTQRVTQSQVQRLRVQQDTRAAALFLSHALRELAATDGDIASATPTALRVRGMRWTRVLCTLPQLVGGDIVWFVLRSDPLEFGVRRPDVALDSVLLFRDGDPGTRTDDAWLLGGLVLSSPSNCPDGSAGTLVRVKINPPGSGSDLALNPVVGPPPVPPPPPVAVGSPLLGFQMDEISLYADADGTYWLGRRSADRAGAWNPMQLLVGPLTADGLLFAYFDGNGAPTVVPTAIASVGVVVRGRSPEPARLATGGIGYVQDSVITRVTLRNNQRF